MTILIAGGAGFIGGVFTRELLRKGEQSVIVLDNFSNPSHSILDLQKSGCRVVKLDIRNEIQAEKFADVSQIINFAAETHNDDSLRRPRDFVDTNIIGTLNLLELARKLDARFHQVSTDEVFGDTSLESSEKFSPSTPYEPSSPYSSSKASADLLVMAWIRSFKLRATISYCTNNYGPTQSPEKLIPRTVMRIQRGEAPIIYGSGANVRDWIHVNDHAQGLMKALEFGEPGERFFFSSDDEISSQDVVRRILEISGSQLQPQFIEDRPGHDRRYALNSDWTRRRLLWAPRENFDESLRETVLALIELGPRKDFLDEGGLSLGRT